MNKQRSVPQVVVKTEQIPEARINYDKFLEELRACGSIAKAARAVGVSRRAVYWRAKNDAQFRAQLDEIRKDLNHLDAQSPLEMAALNTPQSLPDALKTPDSLKPADHSQAMPQWQKEFEASLRVHGLVHIAAIQAGLDPNKVQKLLKDNPDYVERLRVLGEEANSRMLYFARERAMSGRADQLLIAWLKAFNENFRDKSSVQINGTMRHGHQHVVLTPAVLEQMGRDWESVAGDGRR